MEESNKQKIIQKLESSTGANTIFLEKIGENLCWGFNSVSGASGVAITNDKIEGQIVLSSHTLESLLKKINAQ